MFNSDERQGFNSDWQEFLAETEAYQKSVRSGHASAKKDLLGGDKPSVKTGAPFDKDPDYKRSKNAPPGFGAIGEENDHVNQDVEIPEIPVEEGVLLENNSEELTTPIYRFIWKWAQPEVSLPGSKALKRLGAGRMGHAYKAGNYVVKYTSDELEAKACRLVELSEKKSAFVYNVKKVGRMANRFVIIYEYLKDPSSEMKAAANLMLDILKSGGLASVDGRDKRIGTYLKAKNSMHDLPKIKEWVSVLYEDLSEISHERPMDISFVFHYAKRKFEDETEARYVAILSAVLMASISGTSFLKMEDPKKFTKQLEKAQKSKLFYYMMQILEGLRYLASLGIGFVDAHDGNIMKGKKGQLVLIDIGLSYMESPKEIENIPHDITD